MLLDPRREGRGPLLREGAALAQRWLAIADALDDGATKAAWLSELRGKPCELLVPQRGERKRAQSERIQLDLLGRRVLAAGVEIETTAKEFDLLRLLVQHPGQVLTREQIMERIWGEHFTLRTIDNFIARLRSKIEVNPDAPLHLETVRGVGYRFNP